YRISQPSRLTTLACAFQREIRLSDTRPTAETTRRPAETALKETAKLELSSPATSTVGSGSEAKLNETWLCLALLTGTRMPSTAIFNRSRWSDSAVKALTRFRRQ